VGRNGGVATLADSVFIIRRDLRQDLPATGAFAAIRQFNHDTNVGDIFNREGTLGRGAFRQGNAGSNADLGSIQAIHGGEIFTRGIDRRMALQRGTDTFFPSLHLQGAGYHTAQGPHLGPARGQGIVAPINRNFRELAQMHTVIFGEASSAVKQRIGANHAVKQENT